MQEVFENIVEKLAKEKDLAWQFTDSEDNQTNARFYGKVDAFEKAIEIVEQAVTEYNNGWIPCSEQLPKYGEVVMCCCENGGITVSCITSKCVKLSKIVWFGQHRVIAWQPLPAPYQPKGE